MSPEANATFVSKMFFAWFDGLIWKGWKNPLKADDLYELNPDDHSTHILPKWEENWQKQRERKSRNAKTPNGIYLSIVPTMIRSFGGLFAVASFVRFINILMQLVRESAVTKVFYVPLQPIFCIQNMALKILNYILS